MTDEIPHVPASRLREAAALHIADAGLRQAARDTGLSPSGLRRIVDGTKMQPESVRLLTVWYAGWEAQREGLSYGTARAVLEMLAAHLPKKRREEVIARIAGELERAGEAAKMPAPPWLAELRKDAEDESGD